MSAAIPARTVEDHLAPGTGPGDVMPMRDESGRVWGLAILCPGCGSPSEIPLRPTSLRPSWEVTEGDPAVAEAMTLSPSIFHTVEAGGCGWHGHLRRGVFA